MHQLHECIPRPRAFRHRHAEHVTALLGPTHAILHDVNFPVPEMREARGRIQFAFALLKRLCLFFHGS